MAQHFSSYIAPGELPPSFSDELRLLRQSLARRVTHLNVFSKAMGFVITAVLGLAIGSGAMMLGTSMVDAGDEGMYEIANNQEKRERGIQARYAQKHQEQRNWGISAIFSSLGPVEAPRDNRLSGKPLSLTGAEKTPPARPRMAGLSQGKNGAIPSLDQRRSVCVRMCDGYHFPIGNLGEGEDASAHEAICQATCPSAPVKLFTMAPKEGEIEKAVSRDGRTTYANMPMAFAYQRNTDEACTCHGGASHATRVSVLKDFTLRAGDTVVLDGKVKVFNGSESFPYSARDFSDLHSTRALNRTARKQVRDIIGQSARRTKPLDAFREVQAPALYTPRADNASIRSVSSPVL